MARLLIQRVALVLSVMFVGILIGGLEGARAESECYADWSKAAELVKEQGLVSVRDVSKRAKKELKGKVIKATLCGNDKGDFVYKLVIESADGKLSTATVNARKPFDR